MSLLLDALKKAELANEIQSKEENVNDDKVESEDIESYSLSTASSSRLTFDEDSQATQHVSTELQEDQEKKLEANDSQAHALPNMSFIKNKRHISESSKSKGLSLEPKHSQPAEPAVGVISNRKPSIATNESTQSTFAMQGVKNQSDSTEKFQPYRPKPNISKPWFIAVSALCLTVIGSTGAYYFFEKLNEISQESNLSRAEPDTSIQDDIASLNTTSSISSGKGEPLIASSSITTFNPLARVKTDTTPALKSLVKNEQKKHVKKQTKSAIQTTTNSESSRTPIDIIKKNRINPLQELLQFAYSAYVNDNYKEANKLYRKALSLKKNNRDALIGLAIIAHRSNQPSTARRYYKMILSLNPKDSQAASGLIALMQGSNPTASESRLKIMLENEPQAAHLHFTLGNQYVKQARWADAQQAFFQAYHARPENADYALNLAVSLDHIKQPRAALKYYQLALKLAKGKHVAFNVLDIAARVRTLTKDISQ